MHVSAHPPSCLCPCIQIFLHIQIYLRLPCVDLRSSPLPPSCPPKGGTGMGMTVTNRRFDRLRRRQRMAISFLQILGQALLALICSCTCNPSVGKKGGGHGHGWMHHGIAMIDHPKGWCIKSSIMQIFGSPLVHHHCCHSSLQLGAGNLC